MTTVYLSAPNLMLTLCSLSYSQCHRKEPLGMDFGFHVSLERLCGGTSKPSQPGGKQVMEVLNGYGGGLHGLGVVASHMPHLPSQMNSHWLDAVSWTAAAGQSPWFDLELSDICPCCCIPRVQRALVSQSSYFGAAWWGLWAPGQPSLLSLPGKPLGVQHM